MENLHLIKRQAKNRTNARLLIVEKPRENHPKFFAEKERTSLEFGPISADFIF